MNRTESKDLPDFLKTGTGSKGRGKRRWVNGGIALE